MTTRGKPIAALILALATTAMFLTGCWDNKEIDKLSIISGTAVDVSDVPGMIDITLEIANIQENSPNSSQNESGQTAFTMLKATSETVLGGILQIDQNSNRETMPKHNRMRLFGSALCEQGLKPYIDIYMRDQQARLEVPMLVVDGSARAAISAKVAEEELCGMFLAGMIEDLSQVSAAYRIRLIDLMKTLLTGTTSAVIPLVKLFSEGEKQEINMIGMAVFKDDRMVGRLSNDEGLGYIWSLGDVKRSNAVLTEGFSKAVLHISRLDCKREVSLRPDGGVRVDLRLKVTSSLSELVGFEEMSPKELLPHLEKLAADEIKGKILGVFESAKALRADIFGFGASVYQRYPKTWKDMEPRWEELFQDIAFSVEVDPLIVSTGQIVQSLGMEEHMK